MSGLAGLRWFDDRRQAAIADIRPTLGRLVHRGPDGLFATASGPCIVGVAHFVTTPEARSERQPVTTAHGLTVSFDGRLDNADELRDALGAVRAAAPADAEVVATAWQRWGPAALERLLGDFALAVWDARSRRVWLARDVFGLRPLLYRAHGGGFWWASELQSLARLGDARVNEGMVAEYLADAIRSERETLVRGVYRVPRASVLTLDANGSISITRYWTPAVRTLRSLSSDAEAVEEFRAVFAPAVRARVRADQPIALALSGGLDSSLIAAEAASLVGVGDAPGVHAFTLAYPPGHHGDEAPYAQAVADHVQLPLTRCEIGTATWQAIVDDAGEALDMPQPPNCVAAHSMSNALRARGLRVCLNGVGGNEWFSGYHFAFADYLRHGRLLRMVSRMRALRREDPGYRPWSDLRLALWMQFSEPVKQRLREALQLRKTPGWISSGLAARSRLADRMHGAATVEGFQTHQQRMMFEWATNADKMFFTEYTERINAVFACEERSPFLDRRLVEWALTLPEDQRLRGGMDKVILRQAAAPVLPAHIAARGRGPDFSFQTSAGLEQIGGRALVMAIAREREDWVDAEEVSRLWEQMIAPRRGGPRYGYFAWVLWLLVGTHLAARAIEDGGGRSSAGRLAAAITERTIDGRREASIREAV